ncbi:hypothetical protein evm_009912 [Chilo suppressalis]|nr:hypothetical protein evm_009912 [Chilo suppressalis]
MDSGALEPAPNGAVHLDTVRSLHQTVVSLRTALEVSKNELKELKEKYEKHSQCNEFADVIEKLTIENHILRRKIIDSGHEEKDIDSQNIKLEVTYSPRTQTNEDYSSEVVIQTATTDANTTLHTSDACAIDTVEGDQFCSADKVNESLETQLQSAESKSSTNVTSSTDAEEDEFQNSQVTSFQQETEDQPAYRTKLELLSKFDVRIKVRTLKEGAVASSSTSDTDSIAGDKKPDSDSSDIKPTFQFKEKKDHFENLADSKGNKVNLKTATTENVKMAVPNEAEAKSKVDKFDVQVRITSEENLVVKENFERTRRKDTLNLDVDDLSLRSMSEGDNSVFSEGVTTPIDPNVGIGTDEKLDQENASGNESEEVDDIELIFTTDESKDMSNLQERLVSIRESESLGPSSISTHSTQLHSKEEQLVFDSFHEPHHHFRTIVSRFFAEAVLSKCGIFWKTIANESESDEYLPQPIHIVAQFPSPGNEHAAERVSAPPSETLGLLAPYPQRFAFLNYQMVRKPFPTEQQRMGIHGATSAMEGRDHLPLG